MSIKAPVTNIVFEAFAKGSANVVRLVQRELKDSAEDMDVEGVEDAFQQLAELASFGLDLSRHLDEYAENPDSCCGLMPQCPDCPAETGPAERDEEEEE
jgi:hypothetical protein